MKLKLTLRRTAGPPVDIVATVDARATVGDLAAHLVAADPHSRRHGPTTGPHLAAGPVPGQGHGAESGQPGHAYGSLTLIAGDQRPLEAQVAVADSGLRSGAVVAIGRAGGAYADPASGTAATVRVVAGPDAGREFALATGSSVIGRDRGCEVLLSDPLVSRRHARLNITDVAEVIDQGSANGVQVGSAPVVRSVLRGGDVVRIGDTELAVVVHRSARTADASVGVVRSPRLDPRYEGVELPAPEPPQRRPNPRFPWIALAAPLLMGAVLYLVTRSTTALLFVALGPVMIIGYAVESMIASRSEFTKAMAEFRADTASLVEDATAAAAMEVEHRNREHPPVAECVDAVRRVTPLLWARRPADPGFCEVRLGSGPQPSRSTIELPDARRGPRALHAELVAATAGFATVHGVPVVATPAGHGAIGLAGPRTALLDVARAVVVQLVCLHSPAELVLTAFASSWTARDWDWLKWLPHTTSPHSPLTVRHLTTDATTGAELASELDDLVARAGRDGSTGSTGGDGAHPVVVVLVEDDSPVERSRLVQLAETGWRQGVFVVWIAPDVARLPAACRTYLAPHPDAPVATAGFVHSGCGVEPVTVDLVDAATAADVARRLAPLVDTGARVDDDSDLPRAVSLLRVSEQPLVASAPAVVERWLENRSIVTGRYAPAAGADSGPRTLRAVIGTSARGPHALDLRADGPHALVGGTTGSGKSELLQAWILAMAAAHSPERLTFLLVDYKGGAAFQELDHLPHNVGLFTDLSPHLVRRALTSLAAELKGRERLFDQHHVKDLVELERRAPQIAPPNLVIVVDEFAALVTELPEFVDGMVDVAQRGRSLGVHLILATQRPAGVIRDNLRANTNLRLALRTADETDSTDVLGSPEAAFFDQALPGRAVSKTGPGRLVPFQVGYAGGWTTDEPPAPEIVVQELHFGGGARWKPPVVAGTTDPGPTDIRRLVAAIGEASRQAGLPRPHRPWLPELATHYDLSDPRQVPTPRRDDVLVFGIADDPGAQRQPPVSFRPDVDGNLAVYGTGGSGKTTLLRTLAVAAGFTVDGGPCHVYGLDFGARGLAMLEDLPHVGSIVAGADHERVRRLITLLRDLVDERALRYSAVDAGTIAEYRRVAHAPREPRVLLLVDNVAALRQAYELPHAALFDTLIGVANDGRPVGVHVLLSADRSVAVPSALASAVQTRVVLRMADAGDYALMGEATDVLDASSPPGRGLLRGAELQVAMLGSRPDVGSQAAVVRQFAAVLRDAGVPAAPPIRRLDEHIPLSSLPARDDAGRPVLGRSSEAFEPMAFEPRGTFVVTGPAGSGRTTAVHTIAAALRRWDPSVALHHLSARTSPLAGLALWSSTTRGIADCGVRAAELATLPADAGPVAVFLEDVAAFATDYTGAADAVTELIRLCVERGWLFVSEADVSAIGSSGGVLGQAKISRTGLVLAPTSGDGAVLGTTFPPRLNRADFPPGRGLHTTAGRTRIVQVAVPA
jgi:DNA segregation ATPase FtsK/SpoIIIE, S-DNA-T family